MGDDRSKPPPLERRVPGATRAGPASPTRPELPEALLQRMQAVVKAAHAQAHARGGAARRATGSGRAPRRQRPCPSESQGRPERQNRRTGCGGLRGPPRRRGVCQTRMRSSIRILSCRASRLRGLLRVRPLTGQAAQPDQAAQQNHRPQQTHTHNKATPRKAVPSSKTTPQSRIMPLSRIAPRGGGIAAPAKRDRAAQAGRERAEQERAATRTRRAERGRTRTRRARERGRAGARPSASKAARERSEQRAGRARASGARTPASRRAQAERERARARKRTRTRRAGAGRTRASRTRTRRAGAGRARASERERAAQAERATQAERELAAEAAWAEREHAAQAEHEHAAQADRERPGQAAAAEGPAEAEQGVAERAGQAQRTAPSDQAEPGPTASPTSRAAAAVRAPVDLLEHPRPSALKTPGRRRSSHGGLDRRGGRGPGRRAAGSRAVASLADQAQCGRDQPATRRRPGWPSRSAVMRSCLVMSRCAWLSERTGFPVGDLLVMGPKARDLLRSQVIVSTAAIRNLFGSRLHSVYAPTVLASFGSGKARIDVRVIAPDGAASYLSALKADWQQRKTIGRALAGAPQITLTPTARRQMDGGQVDVQLLARASPSMASIHPLDILAFGDLAPGASPGIPLRSRHLAENGGTAAVRSMLGILAPATVATSAPRTPRRHSSTDNPSCSSSSTRRARCCLIQRFGPMTKRLAARYG